MSGPFDERYYRKTLYRELPNSPRNRRRLDEVVRLRPSGGRLLEIGSAEGGFLSLAAARFDVLGIDASEYAVRRARERYGLPVEVKNVEHDPLPGSVFDVIVAFNVLEHLSDPSTAIARLFDVLKPGGALIGSVPNAGGFVGRPAAFVGNRLDRSHRSVFRPEVWGRIFQAAGFTAIRFFGELNFGRNRSVYIRRSAWKHLAIGLMFICEKLGDS